MQEQGVAPDMITYNALISACDKSKQLVREQMKKNGKAKRTAKPEQPNLRQTKRLRGPAKLEAKFV